MLIVCTTKGCNQTSEAKLNRDTGEVICEECGNPIKNITPFAKKALSSMGQVLRNKMNKPFQALCQTCKVHRELFVEDGKAHCKTCSTQVAISHAFLHGLKLHLAKEEKE